MVGGIVMWIARDKYNCVMAFVDKPIKGGCTFKCSNPDIYESEYRVMVLPDNEFPEVTWENSPIEITTTIK